MLLNTLLALIATAHAAFVVNDPKNVLQSIGQWQHMPAFEQAMTCGQNTTADFTTSHCDIKCTRWCESRCEPTPSAAQASYGLHTDECTPDLTHIFGDNGLILDVTKAKYVAGGNTFVIPFLENAGLFIQPEGTFTITDGFPRLENMIVDGKMRSLSVYNIHGELTFGPDSMHEDFDLLITDQLSGINQIVMFSIGQEDTFLKIRGFIDPTHRSFH